MDAHVARKAAEAGLDLTFLRTIPGSIGGAVRMNAGCYGSYVADHLIAVRCVTRQGEVVDLPAADLKLAIRLTRYGCERNGSHAAYSRAAYERLHAFYADTVAAKATPRSGASAPGIVQSRQPSGYA